MLGRMRPPRVNDIHDFTLAEIVFAMDDDPSATRPPSNAVAVGHEAVLAYARQLRAMRAGEITPRDYLERVRNV